MALLIPALLAILHGADVVLVVPVLLAALGVLHPCPGKDLKMPAPATDPPLLGPDVVLAIPATAVSVNPDAEV